MNKLFNLSQARELLYRKRIDDIYHDSLSYDVVSVIAGAGYGKTQSVMSFVSKLDAHIIWVPFSPLDNYTVHFWENFCNALNTIDPKCSNQIKKIGFPTDAVTMHYFIEKFKLILQQEKAIILVFDDCHLISENAICNFISTLPTIKSQHSTTFLLSRPESMLNSPNNLQGYSAAFVNEETLAFSLSEIKEYFQIINFSPSTSILETIYEKTEGWPIAVYLFVLYIKENPTTVISSYQFSDTLLFDMIDREIFSGYSLEEQQFLLKLSLLDFIPVRYMKEVYGKKEMQHISRNLLFRYNEHSHSYHLHHLFKEFLRQHSDQLGKTEIKKTYQTAAQWFLKYDLIVDALHCYKALNDQEGLWNIIWTSLISSKTLSKELVVYLAEILDEYFDLNDSQNPWITLVKASFYSLMAKYELAEQYFTLCIENHMKYCSNHINRLIIGEAHINLALICMLHGDITFRDHFKQARKFLPSGSMFFLDKRMVLLNGDSITLNKGQYGELEAWIQALRDSSEDTDFLLHNSIHGMDDVAAAQAFYYQGNMTQAEQYAFITLQRAKKKQCVDITCYAYYVLMKISIFRGDYKKSCQYIDESYQYMKKYNHNPSYNLPEIAESFFYIQLSCEDLVKEWILIDSNYYDCLLLSNYGLERILKAHYLLKQERYSELFSYLDHTKEIYLNGNRFIGMIYIQLLYCFTYHQTGDDEKAVQSFDNAYKMASPNNIIMPFVEMGRLTRGIVKTIAAKTTVIPSEWLNMIQTKASTYRKRIQQLNTAYLRENSNYDSKKILSSREKQLLTYMTQGLTREELSEEMNLSVNTIKSMMKNIYSKLGAINSNHAIYIAMKDNLIE